MKFKIAALLALACIVPACVSNPQQPEATATPKSQLQFVDLQRFDQDLSGSLAAPLPQVDVAFYDRIAPSAIPDRLQSWLAAVETGGGKVKVTPPKSAVTTRNPFLLISAASTLWSASKTAQEMSVKYQFRPAQSYDAEIVLKLDDKGDTTVDKIVFLQRSK